MLKSLVNTLLLALITILPFIFWTLTPNFITTPKEILIYLGAITLLLTLAYSIFSDHKIVVPKFLDILPLALFALSIIGSLIANPEGRPEALTGKALLLLTLPLLSYFLLVYKSSSFGTYLKVIIMGTGILLSLHSLASLTFLSRSIYIPTFMQSMSFTPTGNYLSTLTLILASLALSIGTLRHTNSLRPLSLANLIVGSVATVAIISLMFPGGSLAPTLLSYRESWSIALDALKTLRTLFFGIGLSNYSLLFSAVKPLSVNAGSLWSTLPTSAASEVLTLLPTAGILATVSLLYLMLKSLISSHNTPYFYITLLIIISLFLTPATLLHYALFFYLYAVNRTQDNTNHSLQSPAYFVLGALALLLAFFIATPASRMLLSEYSLRRAQLALAASDSQQVYDKHIQALKYSPSIANYHLSFAEVNFRLASALSQKPELTEPERETITNLIQQSIQSSKTAIALRPSDSRTWLTIAKIYQNLINVAAGSENFALEAYARAISLDRANPTLRVDYATLLSQLATKQTEATGAANLNNRAMIELQTAIQLKSDFANAYYNLAKLYELTGDTNNAVAALETTLKYLENGSNDYNRTLSELETLKTKGELPPPSASPFPSPIGGDLIEVPAP